ncbi:MAG: hypothetical protein ACREHD_04160 [Pirellulales bacterium]
MHGSPVVFCERTGNWAAAWRRVETRFAAHGDSRVNTPRLIETRSPSECREVLAKHRGAFVVAELSPPVLEPALDLLFQIRTEISEAATAVVTARPLRAYEWLARELGAQAFVVSPLELESLRVLAVRHLAKSAASYVDVRQRIWENLPWS